MSDTPQDPTNPDDTPTPQEPQAPEEPTPAEAVGVGGQETPEGAHEISADEAASRTVTLVDPLTRARSTASRRSTSTTRCSARTSTTR